MNGTRSRVIATLAVVLLLGGVAASALLQSEGKPGGDTKPEEGPKRKGKGKEAEDKQPTGGNSGAILKATEAYSEAFNKGDLDGVMALWAADADYVSDEGKSFKGRTAIGGEFKRILSQVKGLKISFKINSLRFPRPDVALEDGTARGVNSSGQVNTSRYTAIWVKNDGKWLLSSVRDYPNEVSDTRPSTEALKELSWLVGTWIGEGPKSETHLVCRWGPNQTYLLIDYTIKRDGETNRVEQRIGWDPVNQTIRSWVFDSEGGFGEGYWMRGGNNWTVNMDSTLPDGRTGTSVNIYQFVDEGHFTWQAKDREIDKQPLADAQVKFVKAVDRK